MTSEIPDETRVERMKAIGVDKVFVKPLSTADMARFLKNIKFDVPKD